MINPLKSSNDLMVAEPNAYNYYHVWDTIDFLMPKLLGPNESCLNLDLRESAYYK